MIVCTAKNFIKEGGEEEFKELARELINNSQQEEGCIEYQLYRAQDKNSVFCFIEKWRTRADLEAHFETEHFKRIVPQIEELKAKEDEVTIYQEAVLSE